jgi:hypothetical protein
MLRWIIWLAWSTGKHPSASDTGKYLCSLVCCVLFERGVIVCVICRRDLSRWPRDTLYQESLALTSKTSGGRSVGIVRLRTQVMEFDLYASSSPPMTRRAKTEVFEPASTRGYLKDGVLFEIIYINSVRTLQETYYVSATKPNRLMVFRETVAVYCENHTEHTDTLCGQKTQSVPHRKHITSPLQRPTG